MSSKNYPLRIARTATGIRAQELRTLVRKTWWTRRWIAAVESFRLGARLGRGRQYALTGQVTELLIQGPQVTANIQGSREKPYTVNLKFTTPSDDALARLSARLLAQPVLLARVLVGDLPTEIERFFIEEDCPLFPVPGVKPPYDVLMSCSCPDWCKPCKHVAAVLFLLGDEIARRPATLLALRGLDVDLLLPEADTCTTIAQDLTAPRTCDLSDSAPAAIPKRLGPVPFWRGIARCDESLERIYSRTHTALLPVVEGEPLNY